MLTQVELYDSSNGNIFCTFNVNSIKELIKYFSTLEVSKSYIISNDTLVVYDYMYKYSNIKYIEKSYAITFLSYGIMFIDEIINYTDPETLYNIDDVLFMDEFFVLFLFKTIKIIPNEYLDLIKQKLNINEKLVLKIVYLYPDFINNLPAKFEEDKDIIINTVRKNRYDKNHENEQVEYYNGIIKSRKQKGFSLKYLSKKVKYNIPSILNTIINHNFSLEYLSKDILNNKEFILEAIKQNLNALKYASYDLQNDKEIVLEAVKQNGLSLKYVSDDLQNDKEIVLEAVKQNGLSLKYTSEDLQNDKEFMLEAVKQNLNALKYASDDLQNDKEFMLEAVKQNGLSLKYASDDLQNDKEFMLEAVKQNLNALKYASDDLQNDKEFMLEAVKQNGLSLKYTSEDLQNDKEFMLEAVKYSSRYAPR
jgi:lambda repressor-like predicted transcriptional regulator/Fe-S-cluster formation regulator IscX/YfhJ